MIPRWRQILHAIRAGKSTSRELRQATGHKINSVNRSTRVLEERGWIVASGIVASGHGHPLTVWRAKGAA